MEWFLPYRMVEYGGVYVTATLLFLIVCGIMFVAIYIGKKRAKKWLVFCGWPFFYLVFVVAWMIASGELEMGLNHRILLPMSFLLLPVFYLSMWDIMEVWRLRSFVGTVLFICLLAVSGVRDIRFVWRIYHEGLCYNALKWRESPTFLYAIAMDEDIPLYSNSPDVFMLHAPSVEVRALPHKLKFYTGETNTAFHKEIEVLRKDMIEKNAKIIIFENMYVSEEEIAPYRVAPSDLMNMLNLRISKHFADGFILVNE